jgi:hypothetical protein
MRALTQKIVRASRERDAVRAQGLLNQAVYLTQRRHGASPFRARIHVHLFRLECARRLFSLLIWRVFA